jgi:8-oxo-dGDP phosphatase
MEFAVRWTVHGERLVYNSSWVSLHLADIELPDGVRYEHHVVRFNPVAATVVLNAQNEVLMLWRHRFTTDSWSWEIPSGIVESGELPADAAIREVEEETGWRPKSVRRIAYFHPIGGMTNAEHHVFLSDSSVYTGPPKDTHEASEIRWIPLRNALRMIDDQEVLAGVALVGLYATAYGLVR